MDKLETINNPSIPTIPSLYTAITLTYQGERITVTAVDLVHFLMQHPDMQLQYATGYPDVPLPSSSTPENWFKCVESLPLQGNNSRESITLNVAGHPITIKNSNLYTRQENPKSKKVEDSTSLLVDALEAQIRILSRSQASLKKEAVVIECLNKFINFQEALADSEKNRQTLNPSYHELGRLVKGEFPVGKISELAGMSVTALVEGFFSIQKKQEFITNLLADCQGMISDVLKELCKRFEKEKKLLEFFKPIQLGIEIFMNSNEFQSFSEDLKQKDSVEITDFISSVIKMLKRKPNENLFKNLQLPMKKFMQDLEGFFKKREAIAEIIKLNDIDITGKIRTVLKNEAIIGSSFIPICATTIFFSETHRRRNKDIFLASLSLMDLIESGKITPTSNRSYTFENSLYNDKERTVFYDMYGSEISGDALNFIGYHPGSHSNSYEQEMKNRAEFFAFFSLYAKYQKTKESYEQAGVDIKKAVDANEGAARIDALKKIGSQAKNKSEATEKKLSKFWSPGLEKADLSLLIDERITKEVNHLKESKLYLVEQKIAHLLLHWIACKKPHGLNIQLERIVLSLPTHGARSEKESKLVDKFLREIAFPLFRERLSSFEMQLSDYNVSEKLSENVQALIDPSFIEIISELEETEEENASLTYTGSMSTSTIAEDEVSPHVTSKTGPLSPSLSATLSPFILSKGIDSIRPKSPRSSTTGSSGEYSPRAI